MKTWAFISSCLIILFLFSCSVDDTVVVIQAVTDTEEITIDTEVQLQIDGVDMVWSPGSELRKSLGDPATDNYINIVVTDPEFELVSPETYNLRKGETLIINLFVQRVEPSDPAIDDLPDIADRVDPPDVVTPDDPPAHVDPPSPVEREDRIAPDDPPEPESLPEAEDPPELPPPAPHRLTASLQPSNAVLRLVDRADASNRFTIRSGETKNIPEGRYNWVVESSGYVARSSEEVLNLRAGRRSSIEETLIPKRVVVVDSDPQGASVRLKGVTYDRIFTGTTPVTFEARPDIYQWEFNMDGYERVHSRQSAFSDLDMISGDRKDYTLKIQLPDLNIQNIIQNADRYFNRQEYSNALRQYRLIPAPTPCTGERGHHYRHSLNRMGWIFLHDRNNFSLDEAKRTYELLLDCDSQDYIGLLYLGKTLVLLNEFSNARRHLNRILGPLQNQIAQNRNFITSKARYWIAMSYYEAYKNASTPEDQVRLGPTVISHFADFMAFADKNHPDLKELITQSDNFSSEIREQLQ